MSQSPIEGVQVLPELLKVLHDVCRLPGLGDGPSESRVHHTTSLENEELPRKEAGIATKRTLPSQIVQLWWEEDIKHFTGGRMHVNYV